METAMLWLALAGTVAAWVVRGWPSGLGFLAGALASLANFRWLHQLTASLGPASRRPRKRMVFFLMFRYVLLGLCGYVIVRFFGFSLAAALIGLFVPAAAVIVEIVYELIDARA
jgi:ATP synthase I chain